MALWTDYLAKHLLHENHPTLNRQACLNTVQTRRPCSICKEICPHVVFDRAEPAWDYCDNCGACVAACPQNCIVPSALFTTSALEHCDRLRGNVVFSCQEQSGSCDWRLPCLAAIPWELLAFFALDGVVTLMCGPCETCFRHNVWKAWQETLSTALQFIGDSPISERIQLCRDDHLSTERALSRRDAVGLLVSRSRSTLAGLLPEDRELAPNGSLFRRLLLSRLRRLSPPHPFHWTIPAIGESCTACGLCSRLCPSSALQQVEGETGTDGKRDWYLALVPWRCTACGLCSDACPSQSILSPTAIPLSDPLHPLLRPVSAFPCPRCGAPTWERDKLCDLCRGELGIRI